MFSNKRTALLLFWVVCICLFISVSCGAGQKAGFAIYLVKNEELLLTQNEIQSYDSDNKTFALNENGIKKWNSYLKYEGMPKLADTLFAQEFAIKIKGREVGKGKFWSWAASSSYSGVKIYESMMKLDRENNRLWITSDYPGINGKLDPSLSSEIKNFFENPEPAK